MPRIRDLMGTGNSANSARAIAGTFANVTATGTTQGAAALLSAETNYVTTAGGAVAVVLPTADQGSQPGDMSYVFCSTATTCTVFPGGSETINGSTSAVNVAQNKMAVLKKFTNTAWGLMVTA